VNRRDVIAAGAALALGTGATAAERKPIAGSASARPEPQPRATMTAFDFGAAGDGQTDDGPVLQRALAWAEENGRTVVLPSFRYVVRTPVSVTSTGNRTASWGLLGQGAVIASEIQAADRDVIEIRSRHTVRFLTISNLTVRGGGRERNGIRLYSPGDHYLYNVNFLNIQVEGCGASGLALEGNVFETQIMASYFRANGEHGLVMRHLDGGICSAVGVYGSVFGQNGENGIAALDNATDLRVYGGYVLENKKYGLYLSNGTSQGGGLHGVGFENNYMSQRVDQGGAHVFANTRINMTNCTGYTQNGGSKYLLKGYFRDLCRLDTCASDDGAAAEGKCRLALVDGGIEGHVVFQNCSGDIEAQRGTRTSWEAHNCRGKGLDMRGTVRS
jgi:hypothetical protein